MIDALLNCCRFSFQYRASALELRTSWISHDLGFYDFPWGELKQNKKSPLKFGPQRWTQLYLQLMDWCIETTNNIEKSWCFFGRQAQPQSHVRIRSVGFLEVASPRGLCEWDNRLLWRETGANPHQSQAWNWFQQLIRNFCAVRQAILVAQKTGDDEWPIELWQTLGCRV